MTNPEASQEAEIPTPVDDGQGGGVEATTIEPESIEATDEPAAEVEYINPEDLQGKMHKITVDGQEVEVSFEELTQGYNSNRAATQKFQEAAKARQEAERAVGIEQALKVNPVATITALAAEAGQSVQEFLSQAQPEPEPQFESEADRRIFELEQKLQAREAAEARDRVDQELTQTLSGLQTDLQATNEELQNVLASAQQKRLPFEALAGELLVQRHMKGQVQSDVRAEAAAASAADDQARLAAAAAAQGAATVGSQSPAVVSEQVVRPRNPREAIEATLQQLGVE